MLVSPSILSADFWKLNEEIKTVEEYSNWIHVDVMDGHFVPNISIWAPVAKCIKSICPLDCHLMIENPEQYVPDFINAWSSFISTHIELWIESVLKCQELCNNAWVKYWVVINPPTSVEELFPVLDKVDYVLIMSVNPWFWWQNFMPEVLEKVRIIKSKYPRLLVQIDWWINDETVKLAKEAGVDNVVAGSYIFWAKDRKYAIDSLKKF